MFWGFLEHSLIFPEICLSTSISVWVTRFETSPFDLKDLDSNEKLTYKIVGKDEADLKKNLIFFQSPIGKGLIGKNKNDLVEIKTPSGEKNFEIEDVKYL